MQFALKGKKVNGSEKQQIAETPEKKYDRLMNMGSSLWTGVPEPFAVSSNNKASGYFIDAALNALVDNLGAEKATKAAEHAYFSAYQAGHIALNLWMFKHAEVSLDRAIEISTSFSLPEETTEPAVIKKRELELEANTAVSMIVLELYNLKIKALKEEGRNPMKSFSEALTYSTSQNNVGSFLTTSWMQRGIGELRDLMCNISTFDQLLQYKKEERLSMAFKFGEAAVLIKTFVEANSVLPLRIDSEIGRHLLITSTALDIHQFYMLRAESKISEGNATEPNKSIYPIHLSIQSINSSFARFIEEDPRTVFLMRDDSKKDEAK
jgi:hypothetical protein